MQTIRKNETDKKITLFININEKGILDESDYLAFFENIDLEKIASDISKSSSEINRMLRNIDSQKRPVLLSALIICLYPNCGVIFLSDSAVLLLFL
jgi:type I restriction enzyme M protein